MMFHNFFINIENNIRITCIIDSFRISETPTKIVIKDAYRMNEKSKFITLCYNHCTIPLQRPDFGYPPFTQSRFPQRKCPLAKRMQKKVVCSVKRLCVNAISTILRIRLQKTEVFCVLQKFSKLLEMSCRLRILDCRNLAVGTDPSQTCTNLHRPAQT